MVGPVARLRISMQGRKANRHTAAAQLLSNKKIADEIFTKGTSTHVTRSNKAPNQKYAEGQLYKFQYRKGDHSLYKDMDLAADKHKEIANKAIQKAKRL